MSETIDVLIAEDSPTAAELLRDILSSDPRIHVVGVAKDGREAVEKTVELEPDVVTMDIHMPAMNGLEATKQIMTDAPTPIVIVSASARVEQVELSMEALHAGAASVMRRPAPTDDDFDEQARSLVRTVRAIAGLKLVRHRRTARTTDSQRKSADTPAAASPDVVAMAASTGGPSALCTVLHELPEDFPVPIVLVQHITPGFLDGFVTWLDRRIDLPTEVARDGQRPRPGHVYVAPDHHHLGVDADGRFALDDGPPIGGHRPSADHLFLSCHRAFGNGVVAVVLTGMGRDGVDGLRSVRKAGGRVICQDRETSAVYGMPGAVADAELADRVLPLDFIAQAICEEVNVG